MVGSRTGGCCTPCAADSSLNFKPLIVPQMLLSVSQTNYIHTREALDVVGGHVGPALTHNREMGLDKKHKIRAYD